MASDLGQAEVDDAKVEVGVDEAVLSLEVPMHDAVLMDVAQAPDKHVHHLADFIFRQNRLLLVLLTTHPLVEGFDDAREFAAFLEVLHDDVHVALVFVGFNVGDDVGVVEQG